MIIWGSGGDHMQLGELEAAHCPNCGMRRPYQLLLQYTYRHIYFLRWVSSKQYIAACQICNQGLELDARATEDRLGRNPIPFATRYGWVPLMGLLLLFLIAVIFDPQRSPNPPPRSTARVANSAPRTPR